MSRAQLNASTLADIYSAWCQGFPPLELAKALRLVPETVIAEYVRLDDLARFNPNQG
jgi:hypothetical protein